MRYLLHESHISELPGRQEYLYDCFHLYFLPRIPEGGFIPLIPLGTTDMNIVFITGHANQVASYLRDYIDNLPENIIVATTCFPYNLRKYKRRKTIYVPHTSNGLCYLRNGQPYGFSFDITDAELDLYNSSGDILSRIQSAYDRV